MTKDELIELLAEFEHERWSHWQKYLHSKLTVNNNGEYVLPRDLYMRWEKQVNTPYEQLTEKEKDSDREQVIKYIQLIVSYQHEK